MLFKVKVERALRIRFWFYNFFCKQEVDSTRQEYKFVREKNELIHSFIEQNI